MAKKIALVLVLVLLASMLVVVFAGCAKREETLRIYNWGEYMPEEFTESKFKEFKEWYKEKTGKNITVQYKEYDTNETMYTQIATKHVDYDLVCPSEYMAERMYKEGLLQKLDDETIAVLKSAITPSIYTMLDNNIENSANYFMPYLWGTMGIMFNVNSDENYDVTAAEIEKYGHWASLWDANNVNKIYMKDSVRDAYSIALLYHYTNDLVAARNTYGYTSTQYQTILDNIFSTCDDSSVDLAKNLLTQQKQYVYNYEVDSGKTDMLTTKFTGMFGLFWSCDVGYVMNSIFEDEGTQNFYYVVPDEGSNVWTDGFAIPKYAKNTEAANLFLQWLCDAEVASACMEYCGATTGVQAGADLYKSICEADEDGFFEGTYDGFKEMYMDMMFPSADVLNRCGVMMDFGSYNEKLDKMWMDIVA